MQCKIICPYGFQPTNPGLCVQCEYSPKPVLFFILIEKAKGGF